MAHDRVHIVLAAIILAFVSCSTVPAPATAQDIDRSAPRPPPPQKYQVSSKELYDIGLAFGDTPAFAHKCYDSLSVSDEFLHRFTAKGFSLEAVCLAITSPWVQYSPETGKPLTVSKDFLLVVPDCFRNGKPFLECKFNHDHASSLKLTDAGRQHIHARAVEVDAAVRKIIASGRFATECACESVRWENKQVRFAPGANCRVDAAPACLEQASRRETRTGSLVLEIEGNKFEGVPTKGGTDYGGFDISPRLPGGYAYRIGSPEGDDDSPYLELSPGRKISVGTE